MGIKNINTFLKTKCPNIFKTIKISELKKTNVAIDAAEWVHRNYAVATKEVINQMKNPLDDIDNEKVIRSTIKYLINFIVKWYKKDIHLIWCWDAENNTNKINEKSRRYKKTLKIKDKIEDERKRLIDKYIENSYSIEEKNKDLDKFRKLLSQYTYISKENILLFKHFISDLGFISIQSSTEGEKIASILAQENVCSAVWSNDTDNYALGTPLLITGLYGKEDNEEIYSVVYLSDILDSLSILANKTIKFKTFVDFCIMCGTDFNENIKNIGPMKSWDLIKHYETIENIKLNNPKIMISSLNCKITRQMFAYEKSNVEKSSLVFDLNKFNINLGRILNEFNIIYLYNKFHDEINNIFKR
jgi:flap endonuclease-1